MVTIQAENFTNLGEYIPQPVGEGITVIRLPGSVPSGGQGTAFTTFAGESGLYSILVQYLDESDGAGALTLQVVDATTQTVRATDTITLDQGTTDILGLPPSTWNIEDENNNGSALIQINTGDQIRIIGTRDLEEYARVDFIELTPQTPSASAPTLGNPVEGALNYLENAGPVVISPTGLGITDANTSPINSATVSINNFQAGQDTLLFGGLPAGVQGTFSDATGILNFTGTASAAEYTAILRSIAYSNNSENPNTTQRSISFAVTDVDGTSNTVQREVAISSVNDLPVIQGSLQLNVQSGSTVTLNPAQLTASDVDTLPENILFAVVTPPTNGRLELTTNPNVGATLFTQADLAAGRVQYVHNANTPGTTDSIQIAVDDSVEAPNPAQTLALNITISDVPPTNSPPSVVFPDLISTDVDEPVIFSANSNPITVSDPEGDPITLTVSAAIGSRLNLAQTNNIAIADQDGDETFQVTGSVAAINAALNGLTFTPPAGFTGTTALSLTLNDQNNSNVVQTFQVTVQDVAGGVLSSTESNYLTVEGTNVPKVTQVRVNDQDEAGTLDFGIFRVDDPQGTIGGLTPDAAGYDLAALGISTTIVNTLKDNDIQKFDQLRQLMLNPGENYGFYIIQNGTRDGFLKGDGGTLLLGSVSNGTSPLLIEDTPSGKLLKWELDGDGKYDDFLLNMELSDAPGTTLGANLQGGQEGEVFDFRGISANTTLKATVEVRREANFNNTVVFYAIQDALGTVTDELGNTLRPGDAGYIQAAARASNAASILNGVNNATMTRTFTFNGGGIFAPMLIVNGTLDQLLDNDTGNDPQVYFSFINGNSDGVDHVKLLGDNTFGFEDLAGGGDRDFDDLVLSAKFEVVA
jgi:hypothetical protein